VVQEQAAILADHELLVRRQLADPQRQLLVEQRLLVPQLEQQGAAWGFQAADGMQVVA